MKTAAVLSVIIVMVIAVVIAQDDELICDVTPVGFEDVDPVSQNMVDKIIQMVQGSRAGSFLVKRFISRTIKNPNSILRRMLGKLIQDPNDDNFEEGDIGVDKPMPGPLMNIIQKIYGDTRTVVGYLRAFGFFAKVLNKSPNQMENYQGSIPPCAITEAIKEFQLFNGLEPSGQLTKETRELMTKDRCGNPDVECETEQCIADKEATAGEHLKRKKRYTVVGGRKWKSSDFTYHFQGYTADLTQDVQRSEIERGLREWTDIADVSFTEVANEDDADILIDFGDGSHGDKYAFSGPGGVLAHGFYPRKGEMHFDDDENFTANQYSGINLYYVATHEFGHVLGIMHSRVRRTVMYPYYPGFQSDIDMQLDDIEAARALFGEGSGSVNPLGSGGQSGGAGGRGDGGGGPDNLEEGPEEEEPPSKAVDNLEEMPEQEEEECIARIDAAFNHPTEKYAYVISGGYYVRLEADERNMPVVSEGYPRLVSEQWPGLDAEVDAAFTDYASGKTCFFVKNPDIGHTVLDWDWNLSEMSTHQISETPFAELPDKEIKGIASYRDYVLFLYETDYYLWTSEDGVIPEPQTWPYQSGEKSVHVSGAFDAFLRGYFYTGTSEHPEKYVLFRSRGLVEGGEGLVENYAYRRFEDDMNMEICY